MAYKYDHLSGRRRRDDRDQTQIKHDHNGRAAAELPAESRDESTTAMAPMAMPSSPWRAPRHPNPSGRVPAAGAAHASRRGARYPTCRDNGRPPACRFPRRCARRGLRHGRVVTRAKIAVRLREARTSSLMSMWPSYRRPARKSLRLHRSGLRLPVAAGTLAGCRSPPAGLVRTSRALAQTGRDRAQGRNASSSSASWPGNIRAAVVTSASRLHVADPRRVETTRPPRRPAPHRRPSRHRRPRTELVPINNVAPGVREGARRRLVVPGPARVRGPARTSCPPVLFLPQSSLVASEGWGAGDGRRGGESASTRGTGGRPRWPAREVGFDQRLRASHSAVSGSGGRPR